MSTIVQKGEWRFPVENSFVRDTSISVEARLLYIVIKGYVGPDCAMPFPSLATLARHMDRHRESVQKYLNELEVNGYLSRARVKTGGRFTSTRYELFDRSGKKPLRKLPTTETSSTKKNHSKEIPFREREGGLSATISFQDNGRELNQKIKPYPRSEEEMDAQLVSCGITPRPDHDGDFFKTMVRNKWRINGKPIANWPQVYAARLLVTAPHNSRD